MKNSLPAKFNSKHFKVGMGILVVFAVVGSSFLRGFFKVQEEAPTITSKQTSKVSGLLVIPEICLNQDTSKKVQVTLQGLFKGAQIRVETLADDSGHFSMTAPTGQYSLRAEIGNCFSEQQIHLEPTTEQLYSIELRQKDERSAELDLPMVGGGRFPASIMK